MMSDQFHRALAKVCAVLALSIVFVLSSETTPSFAQTPSDEPATAEQPATAEAEQQAEAEGTTFPPGLDDPGIELEEFEIRLLPLNLEELTALAERWQDIAQQQTQVVVDVAVASNKKEGGPTTDDIDRIVELTELRGKGFDRLSAVVDDLAKKGFILLTSFKVVVTHRFQIEIFP